MSSKKVLRAARVQEDLQRYLLRAEPHTPIDILITALSYELGRLVGQQLPAEFPIDAVLDGVRDTMKLQILAYRDGRLRD